MKGRAEMAEIGKGGHVGPSSHAALLHELREAREEHRSLQLERLEAFNADFAALEEELNGLKALFNNAGSIGKTVVTLEWVIQAPTGGFMRHAYGLTPLVRKTNSSTRERIGHWPRMRELQQKTHPNSLQHRVEVLAAVRATHAPFIKHRKHLDTLLATVRKGDWSGRPDEPLLSQRPRSFETAKRHRGAYIAYISEVVDKLYDAIDLKEQALLANIHAFNKIESVKRNGSLSCAFSIQGTQKERRVGPNGPYFSTVTFNQGRRKSYLLKSGLVTAPNRVTRDVLRSRHLMRHSKTMLPLAREIEAMRDERGRLQELAERIRRALK